MEKKIKNLLITGSEGLIGKLLSSKITGYNIAKLDQIFANYSRYVRSNLQSVAELNEKLAEFLPIDCILHLAAECNSRAAWETVLINNIIATRTLFEFARENNVTKVIFASSNHVTGLYEGNPPSLHLGIEDTKIISHKMPICPDGYYGVSKAFGEAIGRYFSETFNIKTICLRIGSVLKDDNPSINKRYRSTWLSHNDLMSLFEAAINSNVDFGIYYGVSNNTRRFWDLKNAENELNYYPKDNAEHYFKSTSE
jgi:nucleoside-diphosphate-sugar epimerase